MFANLGYSAPTFAQWPETKVLALMADMEKQRPQPKRRAIPDGGEDE